MRRDIFPILMMLMRISQSESCKTKLNLERICDGIYGMEVGQHNNIPSATSCSELCSKNDDCVSIMFDPMSKVCRLNGMRNAAKTSIGCNVTVYYGEVTSAICYPAKRGDSCSSPSACPNPNMFCRGGSCDCVDGYSWWPLRETCRGLCYEYGSGYINQPYYLMRNNILVTGAGSVWGCETICTNHGPQLCRFIEYDGSCYLSTETGFTRPGDVVYENDPVYLQSLRNCK